jgi:hypothetical protein
MVPWNGIKHAWLQKVSSNNMELIMMRHLVPLLSL